MHLASHAPAMIPFGADQTIYLVVDRFYSGTVFREAEVERADFEAVISDLLSGQFKDPVRVVAFNTLEHWADDVTSQVATEIETRCDIAGTAVPDYLTDLVSSHRMRYRQLALRLA